LGRTKVGMALGGGPSREVTFSENANALRWRSLPAPGRILLWHKKLTRTRY
jgi:hypothetical protein